jgi:hypothetical protein
MKKYMIGLIAFLMASATGALGSVTPVPAQEYFPQNKLVNPGFENGSYGWTASGGATKTANATAKGEGSFGYDWDSNSAGQTLVSTAYTVESSLFGKSGLAYCAIKTPSGTSTHTMSVNDGTNDLVTAVTITTSSSQFVRVPINFPFPSSGSVKIKLTSVASNEPEIYIDSCYLGEAYNVSQVNQAQFMGSVVITGCDAAWSTTSTSLADPTVRTSCAYTASGQASAPATMLPAIKFANGLPPGEYVLQYEGLIEQNAANKLSYFQFTDGTNTARELSTFEGPAVNAGSPGITQSISYANAQAGPVTLKIQMKASSGGTAAIYGQSTFPGVIKVYRFPTSSELAYKPDLGPASWSGYHDNTCSWSRTSASYGDPTADTTCAIVERTNRNFGTVTSYLSGSDKLPGIVISLPRAGKYRVEACFAANGPATSTDVLNFELSEVGGTVLAENYVQTSNVSLTAMALCVKGDYLSTAAGSKTFRLRMKSDSGASTISAPATNTSTIEWTIFQLDAALPSPVLIGSVTSTSTGSDHIERVAVGTKCTGSPCTMDSNTPGITSVTRTGTGNYAINFTAGTFSAFPSCVVSGYVRGTANGWCAGNSEGSTSVQSVYCGISSTGAVQDDAFTAICMGPR